MQNQNMYMENMKQTKKVLSSFCLTLDLVFERDWDEHVLTVTFAQEVLLILLGIKIYVG